MSRYYDKQGKPLDGALAWARLFEDGSYRHVAEDFVVRGNHPVRVSTVYLGLDHQYGDGPPLIFETMVFGGVFDGEQERYSTLEQAQAGHAAMVQRVSGKPGAR